jgi:hypothetical protein
MAQQLITKDAFSLDKLMPPAGTEFVCIINKQGRIEQSIFEDGIDISADKKEMFAMGVQLQNSMQSDFDYEFGTVSFTITERENARFVSIPISIGILLAKLGKSADPFSFVDTISKMVNPSTISFQSSGVCQ